jgi:hypothetical protein
MDNDVTRVLLAEKALQLVPWEFNEDLFGNKYGSKRGRQGRI